VINEAFLEKERVDYLHVRQSWRHRNVSRFAEAIESRVNKFHGIFFMIRYLDRARMRVMSLRIKQRVPIAIRDVRACIEIS